ncbi:MAG TPA: histidine phosphatase family protein [Kineosporiaceae bacterium]|nr:histidine phosphatase family protein [Kineosporiaceae bacterium]
MTVDSYVDLYLVRHGESEANVSHTFANRFAEQTDRFAEQTDRFADQTDRFADQVEGAPLTERGRAQARALASRLGVALGNRRASSLRTSPVLRARQTAAILSTRLGVPVLPPCPALTEFDVGVFEGTSDRAHWDRFDALLRAWLLDDRWDQRIEGGESSRDVAARFVPFVRELVAGSVPGEAHVLVTHGGLLRSMVPRVASNVDGRFAYEHDLATTAWVQLRSRNGGGLVCRVWGDLVLDDGSAAQSR